MAPAAPIELPPRRIVRSRPSGGFIHILHPPHRRLQTAINAKPPQSANCTDLQIQPQPGKLSELESYLPCRHTNLPQKPRLHSHTSHINRHPPIRAHECWGMDIDGEYVFVSDAGESGVPMEGARHGDRASPVADEAEDELLRVVILDGAP